MQKDKDMGFNMVLDLFLFMRKVIERPRNYDATLVLAEITQRTDAVVKTLFPKSEDRGLWEKRTGALRSNVQLIVGRAME